MRRVETTSPEDKLALVERNRDSASADRGQRIDMMIGRLLGSNAFARMIASEAKTIAYAVLPRAAVANNGYAVHKGDGMRPMFAVFAVISLFETVILHFLAGLLSWTLAWIVTAADLYLVLMFVGHFRALGQRPVTIANGSLHLRNGVFAEADIVLSDIESAHVGALPGAALLTPLGSLERQNCTVALSRPVPIQMLFGFRVLADCIAFNVAEPEGLAEEIRKTITGQPKPLGQHPLHS